MQLTQIFYALLSLATTLSQEQISQAQSSRERSSELTHVFENRISIQPPCHDFGGVPVDSTRRTSFVILYNGDMPFVFRGLDIPGSCILSSVVLDSCALDSSASRMPLLDTLSFTIIPGDTTIIRAEFTPTDTIEYCSSAVIKSDASEGDSVFTFVGKGVAAVPIFSQTFHDFGEVLTGDTACWSFAIKNIGRYPLRIESLSMRNGQAYSVWPNRGLIAPDSTQEFSASFFPSEPTYYPDTVVMSNNTRFGDSTLVLHGRGIEKPVIDLSATMHDFGEVNAGDSLRWCFTVFNRGNLPLAISDFVVRMNSIFRVAPRSGDIDPKESMKVCVVFAPKDTDSYCDTLMVQSNADTSDSTITLKGTGCSPVLPVTKLDTLDFGGIGVGGMSVLTFGKQNSGCDTLIVDSVWVEQDSTFMIQSYDAYVAPSDSLRIELKFTPVSLTEYRDAVRIESNSWRTPLIELPIQGRGVDGRPPSLVHDFPCSAYYQQPVNLGLEVTDDFSDNPTCVLYYRQGGESASYFRSVDCTGRDSFAIPGTSVTERGIDYYFSASDDVGNASRLPKVAGEYFSISIIIADSVLVRVDSSGHWNDQPRGDMQNAYRLFSIPLLLTNPQPQAVFQNYFGTYDMGVSWRFFDYYNGSYYELGEHGCRTFEPGRAYWLIVNKPHAPIRVGAGKTVQTSDYAYALCNEPRDFRKMKLEPGWNLFGVPYNFPVARDSLSFSGAADHLKDQVWIYQGDGVGWRHKPAALWPWEGYAIHSDSVHTMKIRPVDPTRQNSFSKSIASEKPVVGGWTIRIKARNGRAVDLDNYAGVRMNAIDDWDAFDLYEPPTIGEYITVYFPHLDWRDKSGNFAGDYQSSFKGNASWEFEVRTNLRDDRTIMSFDNFETVPDELEIYLHDLNRGTLHDLRLRNSYSYEELGELTTGRFRLYVGDSVFVQAHGTPNQLSPDNFELKQSFPNPFKDETVMSFSLPYPAEVSLKVFDILGRQVIVLVDGAIKERGRHFVNWAGKDQNGTRVGNGVYVLSFQAGNFAKQQRIVLVK